MKGEYFSFLLAIFLCFFGLSLSKPISEKRNILVSQDVHVKELDLGSVLISRPSKRHIKNSARKILSIIVKSHEQYPENFHYYSIVNSVLSANASSDHDVILVEDARYIGTLVKILSNYPIKYGLDQNYLNEIGTLSWICIGQAAFECQKQLLNEIRTGKLAAFRADRLAFISIGVPVHFPLCSDDTLKGLLSANIIDCSSISPSLDRSSRALITFAIESYHYPAGSGSGKSLSRYIFDEDYDQFDAYFSKSADEVRMIPVLKAAIETHYDTIESRDSGLMKSIQDQLKYESHISLLPPCSAFNDARPYSVKHPPLFDKSNNMRSEQHVFRLIASETAASDRAKECIVGARFMEDIQMQLAFGHWATSFEAKTRSIQLKKNSLNSSTWDYDVNGDDSERYEATIYSGNLVRKAYFPWVPHKKNGKVGDVIFPNVRVESMNELHFAWVHFPLHLPSVIPLDTKYHKCSTEFDNSENQCINIRIRGVGDTIYKKSLYTEDSGSFHPALHQNIKSPLAEFSQKLEWPLPRLTPTEIRGKLSSRQVFVEALMNNASSVHGKAVDDMSRDIWEIDYDLFDRKVGMPLFEGTGSQVDEWYDTRNDEEPDLIWKDEGDGKGYGFCARLNLYSLKIAYKKLGFDGIRYRRRKISGILGMEQTVIIAEPLLKNTAFNDARGPAFYAALEKNEKKYFAIGTDAATLNTGPTWIWQAPREFERTVPASILNGSSSIDDNIKLKIWRSPVLMISNSIFIKLARGLHFCKIVTPSRFMETWLYDF